MPEENRDYRDAIHDCVTNGKGLFEDAELLRDFERYGTSLALTILAEEEFAKAFLCYLLQDKAIPSTPEVWRALRDHHCKHLLTVFMEYLHSDAEQFSVRVKAQYDAKRRLPREVASAVNLFRHERIRRWESPHSKVLERSDYDNKTKRLPNNIDRAKQNALYVDISQEGKTVTTPVSVTAEQVTL
ncbi:MAG: AbiV family abortive infection protein, partial [Terriglobia bacterium]